MPDDPRVQQLLDDLLESDATPESVCRSCPELLPKVRERWRQMCDARVELDGLFPSIAERTTRPAVSPPEDDILPAIPGYEVEAVLGRGGMGIVYKARHLALKRTVALKMLARGRSDQAELVRFKAEAEAVARLQHPNIVQIHEVGEAGGRPFFALEYVAGGSLAQRLAGQTLPSRDAARLVAALAEAMHLAHSRNLVHRDLKPGNVLLAGEADTPVGQCQPKVTDFGLVRQLDAESGQTFDGVVMGTPSYMAPEQAEGRARSAGPAADVHALGAILYECLTGRPPFSGATPLVTLEQVRSREPAAPSSLNRQVPRDLETICLKCLRKQPERRYSSAQEFANDLGRFVRGEPVTARPVGRLERIAKWMRRNPTVGCLSAVAALALVAGTTVSLLFAVQSHRKADELEKQTIQLQVQTRAAQENALRAEENEKEVGRVLLSGLLIPIGRNPHLLTDPLDAAEADAVRQLREAPAPLRLQFLERALRDSETARRVGRRADAVVQSIVGCDRALRADVARLAVQRIQEPGAPQDVMLTCARLGLAVNLADRKWAERSADALLIALRDAPVERLDLRTAQDDYPPLAEALAAVCERLPPTQAADRAARALDILITRLREPTGQNLAFQQLSRAIAAISPRLDAEVAGRAADALGAILRQPDVHQILWPPLCTALAAVCRRLPPSDANAHVNRTVDFIIEARDNTEEKDKFIFPLHAEALGALCGRLDMARTSRVAGTIIAILGEGPTRGGVKSEFIVYPTIVSILTEMAERLDAPGGLRAAEDMVLVLRKSSGNIFVNIEELRAAIVAVCRRLDAAGAARVAEAMVAAVRDPKTAALVSTLFADALAALVSRLTHNQAASFEGALVDSLRADLADAKFPRFRGLLGQALAKACGRTGATAAARAAEALVAAIRDPQTPLETLKPLSVAFAVVSGQLPPKEASAHAKQAADVLDSLWVAKMAPLDRASLAEALSAVWTRLDPTDAAARAKRATAYLEDAFRNPKATPTEISRLAEALSAVYNRLEPAERIGRANAVVDTLVPAFRRPRNDAPTIAQLSEALATLCASLDRPGAARIADALLTRWDDPSVQPFRFLLYEKMFKKVAARLDERDLQRLLEHPLAVGRVQRALLDVLAGSKNRSFRNTWDYLDAAESNGNGTDVLSPGTNR